MSLELGTKATFEVRKHVLSTSLAKSVSILFLSDLHLTSNSQHLVNNIAVTINKLQPDYLIFGGDYVDTKGGIFELKRLLSQLTLPAKSYAIAGNHDQWRWQSQIKQCFLEEGIKWFDQGQFTFRLDQQGFVTDNNHHSVLNIACLHRPHKIKQLANQIDLILCGHLHGGQVVLWKNETGLFPGRLLYRWNVLYERVNDAHLFVSKGLGDTLPIRYNCKRDLLFIELSASN